MHSNTNSSNHVQPIKMENIHLMFQTAVKLRDIFSLLFTAGL